MTVPSDLQLSADPWDVGLGSNTKSKMRWRKRRGHIHRQICETTGMERWGGGMVETERVGLGQAAMGVRLVL